MFPLLLLAILYVWNIVSQYRETHVQHHFDAVVRDSAQEESRSGQCQGVQSYSMAMAWISHPGLDQTESQTSPFDE